MSPHYLQADPPKGTFDPILHFTNDLYRPPEDRNLWIESLEFYGIHERQVVHYLRTSKNSIGKAPHQNFSTPSLTANLFLVVHWTRFQNQ